MCVSTVIQNSTYLANSTNFSQIQTINVIIPNDPLYLTIIAILISFFSVVVGFTTLLIQNYHNRLSVRPLGNIELHDTNSEISIAICNNGLGPMIIKSIETVDKQGTKKDHPADWIPWNELTAEHFFKSFKEKDNIRNGMNEVIFQYNFESESGSPKEQRMKEERKLIRNILKDLTIRIRYSNIYRNEQTKIIQSLEGFGKN
jgi:hypothetical protein